MDKYTILMVADDEDDLSDLEYDPALDDNHTSPQR